MKSATLVSVRKAASCPLVSATVPPACRSRATPARWTVFAEIALLSMVEAGKVCVGYSTSAPSAVAVVGRAPDAVKLTLERCAPPSLMACTALTVMSTDKCVAARPQQHDRARRDRQAGARNQKNAARRCQQRRLASSRDGALRHHLGGRVELEGLRRLSRSRLAVEREAALAMSAAETRRPARQAGLSRQCPDAAGVADGAHQPPHAFRQRRGAQIAFVGDTFIVERKDIAEIGPPLHHLYGEIALGIRPPRGQLRPASGGSTTLRSRSVPERGEVADPIVDAVASRRVADIELRGAPPQGQMGRQPSPPPVNVNRDAAALGMIGIVVDAQDFVDTEQIFVRQIRRSQA